jgi:hypothetical protein
MIAARSTSRLQSTAPKTRKTGAHGVELGRNSPVPAAVGPEVIARTELSILWIADLDPNRRALAREAPLKYTYLPMMGRRHVRIESAQ